MGYTYRHPDSFASIIDVFDVGEAAPVFIAVCVYQGAYSPIARLTTKGV